MNPRTLITVHGYAGDAHQVHILSPYYEHHQCPVYILSPEDSKIEWMGPHSCLFEGKRAYIGQDSWDRQWLQMKRLLDFDFDWVLMNDSDSFCLTPDLPAYLYEDRNAFYSNQVNDFRIPGGTWTDANSSCTWPLDYHQGFPLIAMQPPYFCSKDALRRIVGLGPLPACPTTPFIDWYMVEATVKAGLNFQPFRTGASCETVTPMGKAVMRECILKNGATFIHAVKDQEALNGVLTAHYERTTQL